MRRKVFQGGSRVGGGVGGQDSGPGGQGQTSVRQATAGGSWRGRSRISTPSPGEAPQGRGVEPEWGLLGEERAQPHHRESDILVL